MGRSELCSLADNVWQVLRRCSLRPCDVEIRKSDLQAGWQRLFTAEHQAIAKKLLVVADVNAVPPPGVDGMELFMDGAPLPHGNALGVGPLAIGDIKYKTESGLFKQMLTSKEPLSLDFRHAFAMARELTA